MERPELTQNNTRPKVDLKRLNTSVAMFATSAELCKTEREATYESGAQVKQQKDQYPAPSSCGICHQNPHKIQSTTN
jgi:cytochrome c553